VCPADYRAPSTLLDATPTASEQSTTYKITVATCSHCTATTEIGEINNPDYTTPSKLSLSQIKAVQGVFPFFKINLV